MKKGILFVASACICLCFQVQAQTFEMVANINPGGDAYPNNFVTCGNKLFLTADDGVHGREIWVSDGTLTGTAIVKDIHPGIKGSAPNWLYSWNGKVFFVDDGDGISPGGLWITDGTSSGTFKLNTVFPSTNDSFGFTPYNNKLYFRGADSNGCQLWVTDGTTEGTKMLKKINQTHDNNCIGHLATYNGKLYFPASDSSFKDQLWVTDGTAAGTQLLYNFGGLFGSYPDGLIQFNNKLYFTGWDSINGTMVWVTDGTKSGTHSLNNLNPLLKDHEYRMIKVFNGKLYFSFADSIGEELWVTDASNTGTYLLKTFHYMRIGYSLSSFIAFKDKLYFHGGDDSGGQYGGLWVTDGTPANTTELIQIEPGFEGLVPYNGKLYFIGAIDSQGILLMESDGTNAGTKSALPRIVSNNYPFVDSHQLIVYNNALYFGANKQFNGRELWRMVTNGSGIEKPTGTQKILKVYPNPVNGNTIYLFLGNQINGNIQITMQNSEGKIILNRQLETLENVDHIQVQLPMSIINGYYIMTIKSAGHINNQRLIIER
jgi:ELWxxDGT repeat protein